jgi:hypothetical protein
MRKTTTGIAVLALVLANSLAAHHSLTNYDTTKAVRVKGTIVQFHPINPHSILYLDEQGADGQVHRWAIEGPSALQLNRIGLANLPKEKVTWQIASADTNSTSVAGRLINAELLVMPDGKQQSWGDYGVHKCFAPGYTDQHASK